MVLSITKTGNGQTFKYQKQSVNYYLQLQTLEKLFSFDTFEVIFFHNYVTFLIFLAPGACK